MKRKATTGDYLSKLGNVTKPKRKASKGKGKLSAVPASKQPGRGPRLTVYLETDLHKALRLHAAEHDLSYSDVVSSALRAYFKAAKFGVKLD